LTLVLLAGAGLLLKSFYRMMTVPTGFERDHLLTVTVALPDRVYTTTDPLRRFYQSVLDRLKSLPGADNAGMVSSLPLGMRWFRGDFTIEGQPPNDWMVGKPNVSADYFRTMGIPLLRGRFFDAHDTTAAPPVAIVTASIARHFWGDRDPIGRRLTLDDPKDGHWLTIVGVVGDIKQEKLASPIEPEVYVPFQQEHKTFFMDAGSFVIRTRQDASTMAEAARKQIQTVDPDLPIYETATVQELVDRSAASPRFETRLLTAFATLALVLASIGIYGVVAYGVSQRTQEIGIRRALGAGQANILRIVMGGNLRYLFAGLTLGIAGALAVTRVLATFLYEVEPRDPLVLFLAPALLSAIALLASYLPARKAIAVQPSVALRYEG
jgi:putative ABC transport system permease protein